MFSAILAFFLCCFPPPFDVLFLTMLNQAQSFLAFQSDGLHHGGFFRLSKPVQLTSVAVIIFSNFSQLIAWILNPNTLNYSTDYNQNAIFTNFYSLRAIKTSKTVLRRYLSAYVIKVLLSNGFFFTVLQLWWIFFFHFYEYLGRVFRLCEKYSCSFSFWQIFIMLLIQIGCLAKEIKQRDTKRVKNLKNKSRKKSDAYDCFVFLHRLSVP